jgi:mRNA interferase RelE/StbE
MTWILQVTKPAQKELQKLPASDQARVKAALLALQDDPFSGDVKRLKGQSVARRRRVGAYRVFFDLYPDQATIVVVAIARRTSTTY